MRPPMSPKPPSPDDDERIVEEIYDALDEGDAEKALARAKIALHELGDDPVLRFLAGQAYLELDRPDDAAKELRNAVALDPEDPEFRASLALALFRACRFAEARPEAKAALEADPDLPDALNIGALLDERDGDFAAADAKLAKATELDPERFPPPVRLARSEFEEVVVAAGEMLPENFRAHLAEVATTVEDVPSEAILTEEQPALDPELLGLFVGTALDERTFGTGGALSVEPPRILLFKRNLERFAEDEEHLREEITRTLHHELAHYLGFEEEDMGRMDLD